MTAPDRSDQPGETPQSAAHGHDHPGSGAPPPVPQEKTEGPMDTAEFAERLDVDPERDDAKG